MKGPKELFELNINIVRFTKITSRLNLFILVHL